MHPATKAAALALSSAVLALATPARAVEIGNEDDLASVEVHAFAGQGFIVSKDNNYIVPESNHGSFQFSDVGVNFTKTFGKLRAGVQIYASNYVDPSSFQVRPDWFYLDYRLKDWLGFRAGRVKIPFGLYNESADIDAARTPILLPQSVYPLQDRNYLLAQTGGEVYGYIPLKAAGAVEYRAYGGTIFIDTPAPTPNNPVQTSAFTVPYLVGGRLMWETPLEGLRVGASVQALRIDTTFYVGTAPVDITVPVVLWVASLEYAAHDLTFAMEYSRWNASSTTSNAAIVPATADITNERAYALLSYRAAKWFQPGVYYSVTIPDATVPNLSGANIQHDIATTLRFDINEHWLVKLEGHYMLGSAGLSSALNDNVPLGSLRQNWGVFMAKTTAYF
jgi:hypothetical protein